MKLARLMAFLGVALAAAVPAVAADPSRVFRYAFEVAETGFDPAEI